MFLKFNPAGDAHPIPAQDQNAVDTRGDTITAGQRQAIFSGPQMGVLLEEAASVGADDAQRNGAVMPAVNVYFRRPLSRIGVDGYIWY